MTVEQRRARVAAAEATLTNARLQLERSQVLMRTQSVSQAILDERAAAEGRAQADHLEAAASLREAEIQLSYTDIKTPISGSVGRRWFRPAISSVRKAACSPLSFSPIRSMFCFPSPSAS